MKFYKYDNATRDQAIPRRREMHDTADFFVRDERRCKTEEASLTARDPKTLIRRYVMGCNAKLAVHRMYSYALR